MALTSLPALYSAWAQETPQATQTEDTNGVSSTAETALDSCPTMPVLISADPKSALVFLDGNDSGFQAPTMFLLAGKQHDIQVMAEGYEPLSYQLKCVLGDSVLLQFVLRTQAPALLVAESLGLIQMSPRVVLDSTAPDRKMKSFVNVAEFFMVFPLGQGIIARVLGGETYRKEGNALIISGAVLSLGCIITGKFLSKHQRSSIRAKNEITSRENRTVLLHNQEVDRALKLANRERKTRWESENKNRGQVKVKRYP